MPRNMLRQVFAVFLILTGFAAAASAEVKLAGIFGDHMVLQREMSTPVWGTAEPGEKIDVVLGPYRTEATADAGGCWTARLSPMRAGGPFAMTVTGKNTVTLKDVLVGEVWFCSGQSNLGNLPSVTNAAQEQAAAKYPNMRALAVQGIVADQPQGNVKGTWVTCTPNDAWQFSAVGYFFARDLHKALNVPIGIITTGQGAGIRAFMSKEALDSDLDLQPLLKNWGTPRPDDPQRASGAYNGKIAPLMPYGIRGVAWYQGEGDVGLGYTYRKALPTMINAWRTRWGEGDFPFLIVQLANYGQPRTQPGESRWAEVREAQFLTARKIPHAALAVTIDIGEANDIHPRNKQDVGKRLALAARALVYGEKIVYSGPIYDSMTVEGSRVRLRFKHVGGGLVAKGQGKLAGFAVAGPDKKFVWADARIDGDNVLVSSGEVPQPVAVRYAWADNPEGCNLYNKEALPASPFRTDDWPVLSSPRAK